MSQSEPTDKPGPGKPRFLAPIGQPRDYVDRPAMSVHTEPECVSDAIVDSYASIANFHRSQQHILDVAAALNVRPLLKAEDRIKDLQRRAKHAKVDMRLEIQIMQRDLCRSRQASRQPPKRVTERLGNLESLLDGIAA